MTVRTDATVKLSDYTNADYIPIEDNEIVIYAEQTETITKTFTDDHRTPVIMTDLTHIRKLVATLKFHHRAVRSINLIGTALKVIAGTNKIQSRTVGKNRKRTNRTK